MDERFIFPIDCKTRSLFFFVPMMDMQRKVLCVKIFKPSLIRLPSPTIVYSAIVKIPQMHLLYIWFQFDRTVVVAIWYIWSTQTWTENVLSTRKQIADFAAYAQQGIGYRHHHIYIYRVLRKEMCAVVDCRWKILRRKILIVKCLGLLLYSLCTWTIDCQEK